MRTGPPVAVTTISSHGTPGLQGLLNYYTGDEPSRLKLEKLIRQYLVFNTAQVSDSVIDERYQASIAPEVVALAAAPLYGPERAAHPAADGFHA
jgi:4,5:9,10-diseco-3-hydroxy-5,9,17-trioxoandrosta-1(10),2-diene-4-oate hydrolase